MPFVAELDLLLACCRAQPRDTDLSVLREQLPRIDPNRLLSLARVHRVGPLVRHCLAQLPPDAAPVLVRQGLTQDQQLNSVRALRYGRWHLLLARALAEAGVDFLPFKGISVAARYYGDPALRHAHDLDAWVPWPQWSRARQTLLDLGFKPVAGFSEQELLDRGPAHARFVQNYCNQEMFRNADGDCIELHWRLADNPYAFRIDPEELLAQGEDLRLGGTTLRTLSPTDTLIYLCEHGSKHGWYRLKWLADLPNVLESQAWDWPAVLARARQAGCLRCLLLGLSLARDLFGWQEPAALRPHVGTALIRWQQRVVADRLMHVDHPAALAGLRARLKLLMYQLSLLGNLRSLGHALWRLTLSPADLRAIRLPDRAFMAYRLLRPFTFIKRRLAERATRT